MESKKKQTTKIGNLTRIFMKPMDLMLLFWFLDMLIECIWVSGFVFHHIRSECYSVVDIVCYVQMEMNLRENVVTLIRILHFRHRSQIFRFSMPMVAGNQWSIERLLCNYSNSKWLKCYRMGNGNMNWLKNENIFFFAGWLESGWVQKKWHLFRMCVHVSFVWYIYI